MKVWLIAAVSADGKIAENTDQSSLNWTSKEDTQFFVKKTKEAGVVVMGRTTFATIGRPLKERRVIVLTTKPDDGVPMEGVEYTNASAKELVERLAGEGVATLAVCGGATVYSQFLKEGLVDDVFLTVEPVLFGGGVELGEGFGRIQMTMCDILELNKETRVLHYRVV